MKLTKAALIIALASVGTMAAAESQVTLYGTIDGAVVVNKAKGGDATVSFDDGIAGGSVWGLEGTEDLGNGYSVGFLLENGFIDKIVKRSELKSTIGDILMLHGYK